MPSKQPSISFRQIRNIAELYQWRNKRTGLFTRGFVPPAGAQELTRVPFHIRYVTKKGRLEECNCVSLKHDRRKHLRMIQIVESKAIRYVWDFLVIEIDGRRVLSR